MGSLANGFVFTAEPAFAEIAAAFPGHSARGYRHVTRSLWLLDLFEQPWRGTHVPFTGRTAEISAIPRAQTVETTQFLGALDALLAALPEGEVRHGGRECRLALAIGERAGVPTFFFAGDDESLDLACVVTDGVLERFRCRMEHLTVTHEHGRTELTPNVLVENDEEEPSPELLRAIGRVGWPIAAPVEVVGPQLHESTSLLWPADAGVPAEVLGVGTWDFGEPLERDFRVVFDRPAT
jgi:hypothetical protein